ncbi:MAG: M23 family metallopeptidase, partial [Comamonadaceae bacterium]
LTAYAHLDRASVKENDVVRQGQKLGEMGKSGTDRVKLHFEIRKQGVAVNPEPYLDGKLR